MQVRFYAYRKRINSTKTPTQKDMAGQLSFFADCILKDSTSVIAPQITLIFPHGLLSPSSYNYAYIPDFNRYYFVTDITFLQNRVMYTLACDVLASYWDTLKETTQYVLRSASAGDLSIVDPLYPVTSTISHGYTLTTGWSFNSLSSGYYVLGIINKATDTVGCVSYYVMSNPQFAGLRSALMTDYSYMGISAAEISQELSRAIINPFQYIVSCKWFPEKPPTAGVVNTISVSGWDFTGGSASKLASDAVIIKQFTIDVPMHPQIARGKWLDFRPYSNFYFLFQPFGVITIDPTKLTANRKLDVFVRIDCISGIGHLQISCQGRGAPLIYSADCNIGVDIQLAQQSVAKSILSDVQNAVGSIAQGAVSGGKVGAVLGASSALLSSSTAQGAIAGLVQGIASGDFSNVGSASLAANAELSVKGQNGGLADYRATPALFYQFAYIVDADNEDLGTPCCKKLQLARLSGFTTVMRPDIDMVLATQPEIAALTSYLSNGFFIEGSESPDE